MSKIKASQHACEIAEIISEILSWVRNTKTLASCCRLNSLWFGEAIQYLWSYCGHFTRGESWKSRTPNLSQLKRLEKHRLQLYANCIKTVHLYMALHDQDDGPDYHLLFERVQFPNLQNLELWGWRFERSIRVPWMRPTPPLNGSVNYYGKSIGTTALFTSFRGCNFSLTRACLNIPLAWAEYLEAADLDAIEEAFAQFMICTPNLEVFKAATFLWGCWGRHRSIEAIARHPILRESSLSPIPGSWQLNLVSPFAKVRKIRLHCEGGNVWELPRYIPTLRCLHLEIGESACNFLPACLQLPELQHLSVSQNGNALEATCLARSDLIALGHSCPQLKTLRLPANDGDEPYKINVDHVDLATVSEMFQSLPNLVKLDLGLDSGLFYEDEKLLLTLGSHCKSLEVADLQADIDMPRLLRHAAPNLFPSLSGLHIERVSKVVSHRSKLTTETTDDIAQRLAAKLRRMAPNLKRFTVGLTDSMNYETDGSVKSSIEPSEKELSDLHHNVLWVLLQEFK